MRQDSRLLRVSTSGRGFFEITGHLTDFVRAARMETGLLTVFCRHTSASLLITENADPTVLRDLETVFARLAPEDAAYAHDTEGQDDMPAHIRAALTQTTLSIPLIGGRLTLGTWQGAFLFEHRRRAHGREIALHLIGE
ncbi:MAG: secondary thiamine-phosphate synthase enzyme YjbQ [Methylocystis sp.]|nr:secondary thiamine-phosphate synthase enzyme YjbQ [Methylocystis sp.]